MDHVVIPFPHPPAEHSEHPPQFEGAPPNPVLVGWERDSIPPVPPYARICPPIERMVYCWPCNSVQRFVAVGMFQNGIYGYCVNCLDRRVLPWTHTNNSSF